MCKDNEAYGCTIATESQIACRGAGGYAHDCGECTGIYGSFRDIEHLFVAALLRRDGEKAFHGLQTKLVVRYEQQIAKNAS